MAQFFHRSANSLARISLLAILLLLLGASWFLYAIYRSDYATDVSVAQEQPVQFSHKHHVGGVGVDCRYCHTSVEVGAFAGMPSSETCMSCHSQIWADSPTLEPVRASYRNATPLQWNRVHDLPDFVFFNHSIHVAKGIGCSSCHGRVDLMPLTWKVNSLLMEWCLQCHREPERYIRPREYVFKMDYTAPGSQAELGARLVKEYNVRKLTDCYTCHR